MSRTTAAIAGIAVCLALVVGGQALAGHLVPQASGTSTDEAVAGAASSYLTGLRTFGAAVLWNRIDPLMHEYYSGVSISEQRYMLTTIAVVQALDPSAVQSYYVGSWILVKNDRLSDGLAMARRGVEANPKAGILRVNLAQLLDLYTDDTDGSVEQAKRALADDMTWTDTVERANAYAGLAGVFKDAGRNDLAEVATRRADSVVIDPADIEQNADE